MQSLNEILNNEDAEIVITEFLHYYTEKRLLRNNNNTDYEIYKNELERYISKPLEDFNMDDYEQVTKLLIKYLKIDSSSNCILNKMFAEIKNLLPEILNYCLPLFA